MGVERCHRVYRISVHRISVHRISRYKVYGKRYEHTSPLRSLIEIPNCAHQADEWSRFDFPTPLSPATSPSRCGTFPSTLASKSSIFFSKLVSWLSIADAVPSPLFSQTQWPTISWCLRSGLPREEDPDWRRSATQPLPKICPSSTFCSGTKGLDSLCQIFEYLYSAGACQPRPRQLSTF